MTRRARTPSRPPKPKPEPKKGGRPPYQPTPSERLLVRNAKGLLGLSHEKIARMLNIGITTLTAHFAEELETGSDFMMVQVASTVYQAAVGRPAKYDQQGNLIQTEMKPNTRTAEFLLRTKAGFREREPVPTTGLTQNSGEPIDLDLADCTDEELAIMQRLLEKKIARRTDA